MIRAAYPLAGLLTQPFVLVPCLLRLFFPGHLSADNGRGLTHDGVIQLDKGNYLLADEYVERAWRYTPHSACLHVNVGVLTGLPGQDAEAERHFREA